MEFETIILEKQDGVATLSLNRPDTLNAINNQMRIELLDALDDVEQDAAARVLVITGKGRAFSSGGDVRSMGKGQAERMIGPYPILRKVIGLGKPVIAAVNGVAAGAGFSLAMTGDIILASQEARFIQSAIRIGLVPDWGAMYLLPRLVGMARAKQLMFTGETLPATEAERIGLVSKVVASEEFEGFVRDFARKLAEGPPIAIGMTKKIVNASLGVDLDTLGLLEFQAQTTCRESEDHKEGLAAFKEKRKANFAGK
ncbi:MAG: enoyl-CoA hydratase/isomerase family protein [Chloroflexi bacterium]|nr:enoyl-CoA hydratase/isomerase family protein [Chloroflexota bacterium]